MQVQANQDEARPVGAEAFRIGVIVPTYRHIERLPAIVAKLRASGLPVLVVDDGNSPEIAARIAALHDPAAGVEIVRRPANGGKGAAMKTGFAAAAARGWSHAIQLDADGQHDIEAAATLEALARQHPQKVICGVPVYDASVPAARRLGRQLTHVLVWVETASRAISDSMCGFRAYPLGPTLAVTRAEIIGNRMDYDTEILVQLFWRGLDVIETPIRVTYPEGNVSNFRMLADNVRMTLMHLRLAMQMPIRVPLRALRRGNRG